MHVSDQVNHSLEASQCMFLDQLIDNDSVLYRMSMTSSPVCSQNYKLADLYDIDVVMYRNRCFSCNMFDENFKLPRMKQVSLPTQRLFLTIFFCR